MLWKLVENVKYEDIYEVKRRHYKLHPHLCFHCMVYLYSIMTKLTLHLVVI